GHATDRRRDADVRRVNERRPRRAEAPSHRAFRGSLRRFTAQVGLRLVVLIRGDELTQGLELQLAGFVPRIVRDVGPDAPEFWLVQIALDAVAPLAPRAARNAAALPQTGLLVAQIDVVIEVVERLRTFFGRELAPQQRFGGNGLDDGAIFLGE